MYQVLAVFGRSCSNPMKISSVLIALVCVSTALPAVETKYWQQTEMADFEKGMLTRVSLSSDGHLTLAPVVKEIHDPSVTFLWAVARDSKGNLYAGGGALGASKAKLLVIDPSGTAKILAELDGMAIQAIAIDRQDRVYAATSPDGKIYRVDAAGKAETFYDPHAKYIWALAFSRSGDLFVATGDQGEIHRVKPSQTGAGTGSLFFKTDETHARSLAVDASDNLIVGTDPGGLILRIAPSGGGFVLYQSPKREITAVAVAPDGTIYAAGAGAKQATTLPTPAPSPGSPAPAPNGTAPAARPPASPPPTLAPGAPPVSSGSEIYRIQADGYPRRIWSHNQDLVYALTFDAQGRLIAGTGNRGAIYRIDSDHSYTRLVNLQSTQVTAFCSSPDGHIYAVTGNIGKVIAIGPQLESSGTFESDVYDAGAFTYWGRLSAEPSRHASSIEFETRSGNLARTQQNWSPWAKLNAGKITSPSARFLQYKATLTGSTQLDEVDIAYLMKNVAPVIEEVEITPANYKFPAPSGPSTPSPATLTLPPLGHNRPTTPSLNLSDSPGSSPALTWSKGQIGARWLAGDDNGDTLIYKIEIRGVNESDWKLLKDKIRERYYSWDSTAFPDGRYLVRVSASDTPSNPPDQALSATLESDPFLIDNAPPEITNLRGTPSGSKVEVSFHAKDGLSVIGKAEYSVNGGDWILVEPVNRLTDSMEEDYRVTIDRTPETTVAVRVADEYENQCVSKIVVK